MWINEYKSGGVTTAPNRLQCIAYYQPKVQPNSTVLLEFSLPWLNASESSALTVSLVWESGLTRLSHKVSQSPYRRHDHWNLFASTTEAFMLAQRPVLPLTLSRCHMLTVAEPLQPLAVLYVCTHLSALTWPSAKRKFAVARCPINGLLRPPAGGAPKSTTGVLCDGKASSALCSARAIS